ncbi:MAG: Mur ligase family protein [Coriobacteriia bacterium]|nr:Mur ligase family protein [Coriobacteriia bacterium]
MINPSLDVIEALCAQLDDPQTRYASIQVVGTNGKTSTTRMIEALLRAEGLRTGMTISPAVQSPYERIQIEGTPLSPQEWDDARQAVMRAWDGAHEQDATLPRPSDFEMVTAMALFEFARCVIDVAVVEAGIGGTWDSTCILDPAVVVITSVSLEHTAILGESIEEIALDKAGAIKSGSTVVLSAGVTDGSARRVFEEKARSVGAVVLTGPLSTRDSDHPELRLPIPAHIPLYQLPNIEAALIATEALLGRPLTDSAVRSALETITFPARFEILATTLSGQPLVIYDGAHNPEAALKLAETIVQARRSGLLDQDPLIALGVFRDKDLAGIISALDPVARAYLPLVAPDPKRALPLEDLIDTIAGITERPILDEWDQASPLVVTGTLSLYEIAQKLAYSV